MSRQATKRVNPSTAEKRDLARFGCVFRARPTEFWLDWSGRTGRDASSANVLAIIGLVETVAGPLVCLAFEIFLFRPRPTYFYFPFDLGNSVHRRFLSELVQHGSVRLRFISGRTSVFETEHVISTRYRERGAVLLERALEAFRTHEGPCRYEESVETFERWVRIPEFVEYFFSDRDFSEVLVRVKDAVRLIPEEQRDTALAIVQEIAKTVGPYYDKHGESLFENLRTARKGVLILADLRRIFLGNPEGLIQFFADVIAGSFTQAELKKLQDLVGIGMALTQLPFWSEAETVQDSSKLPEFAPGLLPAVRSLATGTVSQTSMKKLFGLLGFGVRNKPGRPTEDYSREYSLKASGSSWSEVARDALANRAELAEGFGSADYDHLGRAEQEKLTNRIRQGVIGYAKRVKKPLPPTMLSPQSEN